jgi:glutamine cyclotransferase
MRSVVRQLAARLAAGYQAAVGPSTRTPVCSYDIVTSYPHDGQAWTQGLAFDEGRLYEGTGLLGRSSVREVDLVSGRVVRQVEIGDEHFGEGIAIVGDRLFQLTWRSHKGFIYDVQTFAPVGEFAYEGEGWGLTYDGRHLLMSDGTARLRFFDPDSFVVLRTLTVHAEGKPIGRLNDLQYIDGEIFANVYQTDRIARIDPETGEVIAWIDLAGLLAREDRTSSAEVLNGIAYDAETGLLIATGKRWPRTYEIRLVSAAGRTACPTVGPARSERPLVGSI